MSNAFASSSTTLVSFTADPDHTKMEGFKWFKKIYNCHNNWLARDNPNVPYPHPKVIYNQVKNSGYSEREFKSLFLQDFMIAGSIATRHHMKRLSLAPYYHAQMQQFVGQWDARDNQGEGMETVDFCQQVMGVMGAGIYHLMADVQQMVCLFAVVVRSY